MRVIVPWITTGELARNRLRPDPPLRRGRLAVSLRLLRALGDISLCTDDADLCAALARRGRRDVDGARLTLAAGDIARLEARLVTLEGSTL